MSVIGYVLINASMGCEHEVQQSLSEVPEVVERYALHYTSTPDIVSRYDFLLVMNTNDSGSLDRFVESKIRPIQGIARIKTVVGVSFTKTGMM